MAQLIGVRCALICGFIKLEKATIMINKSKLIINSENLTLISSLRYDTDLGASLWDEFIADCEPLMLGRRAVDYMVVGDLNKPAFKVSHLRKQSKVELQELVQELGMYVHDLGTKAELIEELMSADSRLYYTALYDNLGWHDLPCDFKSMSYSPSHTVKVTVIGKGYNFVTPDFITNLLYKTPVQGSIELRCGGNVIEEIYIDEYINPYDFYDKDDTMQAVINKYTGTHSAAIFSKLEESLPETLDFV